MNRVLFSIRDKNLVYEFSDLYIKECISKQKQHSFFKKNRIVNYLKKNQLFGICDITQCIICDAIAEHYETWYTDGEWVWSGDLIHYTKKHNFILPEFFVNTIISNKYKNKKCKKSTLEMLESNEIVLKYAKKYQSVDFNNLLTPS